MILYLLRHGKADWPHWDRPDDERPLTEEGMREMRKIGGALAALKAEPAVILGSPLPRAMQTAELAGRELGVPVREEPALRPGFGIEACRKLLDAHREGDVMFVGHEPDLSSLIAVLTGGEVKLPKAGAAAIELTAKGAGGRLLWLMPGKLLIRLYR